MRFAVPPRPVRRLVLDPLWVPIAAAMVVIFLICAALTALVAPLTPRRRVLRLSALAAVYVALDLWMMLAAFAMWLRHPSPRRDGAKWDRMHCRLLSTALSVLLTTARRAVGFTVRIETPDAPAPGARPLIVLSRHAGPGDSFTLIHLILTTLQRRPRVVVKAALQWDPGLDVMLNRLASCFITSASGAGDDRTAAVAAHAASLRATDALLLFPEGGNWTPRRHRRAVRSLFRRGKRRQARLALANAHVLPPRAAGTLASLAECRQADVLVVAHCGLDQLVTPQKVWDAIPCQDRPMRIHWWLYPASTVPREEAAARPWLSQRWTDIEDWIAATTATAPRSSRARQ